MEMYALCHGTISHSIVSQEKMHKRQHCYCLNVRILTQVKGHFHRTLVMERMQEIWSYSLHSANEETGAQRNTMSCPSWRHITLTMLVSNWHHERHYNKNLQRAQCSFHYTMLSLYATYDTYGKSTLISGAQWIGNWKHKQQ